MPRRKANTSDIEWEPVKAELISQFSTMLDEEEENMTAVLARAKTDKVSATVHIEVDNSTDQPIAKSGMKYGENYTNKKVSQLDPDQGKFTEVLESAKGKGKSKKSAQELDEV